MCLVMAMPVFLKRNVKVGEYDWELPTTQENLDAVVSLVDLRHDPSADDVQMYEFLSIEIPVIIGDQEQTDSSW